MALFMCGCAYMFEHVCPSLFPFHKGEHLVCIWSLLQCTLESNHLLEVCVCGWSKRRFQNDDSAFFLIFHGGTNGRGRQSMRRKVGVNNWALAVNL